MAYLQFEENAELEVEFVVAEKLCMTVAALRRDMSADEFVRWGVFLARRSQREQIRGVG